ncbi:MAG: hypothetical protein GX633_00605 [Clostridiales bacterium]|nr:hypothetical protein [Clostridiales bacterium]
MKRTAAVYILLGQSNAVGHGIPMEEKDIILKPMKNVFGLSREFNQSYDNDRLRWSGYTSFGMNLAEEQDNTYSVVNQLAKIWQKEIDEGNDKLPDLYIVQIAIGAEGLTKGYMWYPDREKKLIPGKLGTVDISLYPFTMHILSLLDNSFRELDIDYSILRLDWRGGSNDTTQTNKYLRENLLGLYERMFADFDKILGKVPTTIHRICCPDRVMELDPTGKSLENMHFINSVFYTLARTHDNINVFDVREYPDYIPFVRCNGLFIEDAVHYTPEANMWVAERILAEQKVLFY